MLDENGNVMKDSTGNDIKVPKKVFVKANVLEVYQSKIAGVTGRIEYINAYNNSLLKVEQIAADAIFENYASTFQGDRRALSKETKARIGNQPMPFPPNEVLLMQAAQQLKPVIKNKIAGNPWTQ